MKRLIVLIGGFIVACGSAFAGDLSGTWTGQLPPRLNAQGQTQGLPPQDIVFQFTQSKTTLTGKQYGDYRSAAIIEGQIAGDQINFTVISPEQAGNQTNMTRYAYAGTIQGDEIKLTRKRESSFNVGNGEIAPSRNGGPQTFILKRLI